MSFNATNVTGLNSSISYNHTQGNFSAHGFGLNVDAANNLGYGIGRMIRGAFDSLWNTWQKMSTSEPSALEIAQQRNYMIYEGGLKECVKRLGPALANLQMNPNDRSALKKVEHLSAHFARYLKPSLEENLRELQSTIFGPLEERVSAIAHLPIKNALSKCMPVFFQGNNSICKKAQTDRQSAHTRQSQVKQKFAGDQIRQSSQGTSPEETDQSDSHQLADGFRSVFSSLDAGISKLFSIFPTVSAESVEFNEHEVAVIAKDNQNSATDRIDRAFTAYIVGMTNSQEGIVTAIDMDKNKIIANITVGLDPEAIAVTPNSHYAYVVNSRSATVSVIDTYNNSVITNVALENVCMPWSIAITPNGLYAYVTCHSNKSITVIETIKNTVLTTIGLGKDLEEIAITPDGLYAYVTSPYNRSVSVMETINNSVVNTIDVKEGPFGIAITPDGLYAYVTNSFENSISVINTTSYKVIAKVDLKDDMPLSIAINPNGLYVYALCIRRDPVDSGGLIHVIETRNNTDLDPIRLQVIHPPNGRMAVTPDGLYIYAFAENFCYVVNTTSKIANTEILEYSSKAIAFIPVKTPISNQTNLIIGLSCGGAAFIMLLGMGGYLTAKWLKNEEDPSESNNLIHQLSEQQKTTFI